MKRFTNKLKWGISSVMLVSICLTSASCQDDVRTDGWSNIDTPELLELSAEQKEVLGYLPVNVIIAHRGTEFWAPEESEVAMRWARNIGADYLEIDVQRTKDGVILALHDDNLIRTTNIDLIYPNRKNDYVNTFTWEECLRLDIGQWFNYANPKQARQSFVGEQMLTVEDVVMVAEGYRYVRKRDLPTLYPGITEVEGTQRVNWDEVTEADLAADGHATFVRSKDQITKTYYIPDEADNGHRPGVYIETKAPHLFPGVEKGLREMLSSLQWYGHNLKTIPTQSGMVGIGNTKARVILQTFSKESLTNLGVVEFKDPLIPILFLYGDIPSTPATYADKINYAIANRATIMGPNIDYVSGYPSSIQPWQGDMIRRTGMHIHAWSFNTQEQYIKYTGPWTAITEGKTYSDLNYLDGSFTNLTDLALNYYNGYLQSLTERAENPRNYFRSNAHVGMPDNIHKTKPYYTAQQVLDDLGY